MILFLKPSVDPNFIDILDKMVGKEISVLYIEFTHICSVCSTKCGIMVMLFILINKIREVKKQKYICPKCGYSHMIQLP